VPTTNRREEAVSGATPTHVSHRRARFAGPSGVAVAGWRLAARGTRAFGGAFDVAPFLNTSPFAPALDAEPTRAAMEQELTALREKTKARWAKVTSVLEVGDVYDVILEVAKAQRCDLIVLGTHGRRGLSHALLGSVAEKVVRLSPIPVLTVRPGASPATSATAA
jgi:nucleotide-binding universal stress UspA family protein